MVILKILKLWSKKSSIYLARRNSGNCWFLFANPRLYPLKINSSNIFYLKKFEAIRCWHICVELVKCCVKFFRLVFSCLFAGKLADQKQLSTNAGVSGLIISHRILGVDDKFECPYFGFVAKALQNNNIEVEMQFISHSNGNVNENDLNVVGDFRFELKVAWLATCEFFSVVKHCLTDFKYSVFLLGGCFSLGLVGALRISMRVEDILNKDENIRFIMHSIEGHEWEHSLIGCIRRLDTDVKLIGFQQAPINITSRAIFDILMEFTPPDIVLCSGKYSHELFKTFHSKQPIFTIGTNRSLTGNRSFNRERKSNCVLVVPEGLITEVRIFLSYVKEAYQASSKFHFVFTLHPTMSEQEFYAEVDRYSVNDCVELTKIPLAEAAQCCDWVLYRGSTAVIEAASNGCLPIFVQDKFGTCVNIFDECGYKGLTTFHGSELQHLVDENIEFDRFYEVCNFIFSPFDEKEFSKLKI